MDRSESPHVTPRQHDEAPSNGAPSGETRASARTRAHAECRLPTREALERLQDQWAREGMSFPRERSVVDLFLDHVRSRPHAVAVSTSARELDYAQLNRLSNRVAHRLLRAGLQPEDIVALPLDRSCAYVVAALGVLKAGGAYLPIDPGVPDQRMLLMLSDSGARFAFIAPDQSSRLHGWEGQSFTLDDGADTLSEESHATVDVPSDPRRRAYVIYTSGSTGMPKGVEIEHHSLTHLVCVYQRWPGLTAHDRVPLIANVAFDASVADLWPCLCSGGTVLIPPRHLTTDLDGLIQWMAIEGATHAFMPVGLAEVMLTRPWPDWIALRLLAAGGDTLHVRPPAGLPFAVLNQYGPTENTVDSTWALVAPGDHSERPPIGRPIGNVKAYVLDENRQPVPHGVEGELYLGGEQVARGFINHPELTARQFLADPFDGRPGARMYRTGDWVKMRPDGQLDFIGRHDSQIQIGARRVELGEIEQALHGHPAVKQACCESLLAGGIATGVVAHVSTHEVQPPRLAETLREYLAERLPAYMVPAEFLFYERLPLTSRGKVDRAALRARAPEGPTHFEQSLPEGSRERNIARLWFELLPTASRARIDSTFDSLGGDSLQALKLMLGVEEITGRRIPLSTFLLDPTLPGLLRMVAGLQPNEDKRVIALRQGGDLPPIFCMYGIDGDIYHYLELAKALGDDQPVLGIRSLALTDIDKLPESMEEAGARALRWLRETHPHQPPALIGFSWGGILAFEVARQWIESEGTEPFVVMVGAPAPRRHADALHRLGHLVRWLPSWSMAKLRERRLSTLTGMGRRLMRFISKDPAEVQSEIPEADWASTPIARHFIALEDRYQPAVEKPFEVHLFRESRSKRRTFPHPLDSSFTEHLPDSGWSRWAGRPARVHWIDTDHESILRAPAVGELAGRLRKLLERHYGVQRKKQSERLVMADAHSWILLAWSWSSSFVVGSC
jgi:amino acid adenylation domain-containing protein